MNPYTRADANKRAAMMSNAVERYTGELRERERIAAEYEGADRDAAMAHVEVMRRLVDAHQHAADCYRAIAEGREMPAWREMR